jgi:hypothetical protein
MSINYRKPVFNAERSEIIESLLHRVPQRKIAENFGRNKDTTSKIAKWMRDVLKESIEVLEKELLIPNNMRVEVLYRLINVSLKETPEERERLLAMLLRQKARREKRKHLNVEGFDIIKLPDLNNR